MLLLFWLFFSPFLPLLFPFCWLVGRVSQDSLNAYAFKVNQHSFHFVWNQICLHYLQQRIQTYATLVRQYMMPFFFCCFIRVVFMCVVEETTTISHFGITTTAPKEKWSNNEHKTWRKHHHFCRASQKAFGNIWSCKVYRSNKSRINCLLRLPKRHHFFVRSSFARCVRAFIRLIFFFLRLAPLQTSFIVVVFLLSLLTSSSIFSALLFWQRREWIALYSPMCVQCPCARRADFCIITRTHTHTYIHSRTYICINVRVLSIIGNIHIDLHAF